METNSTSPNTSPISREKSPFLPFTIPKFSFLLLLLLLLSPVLLIFLILLQIHYYNNSYLPLPCTSVSQFSNRTISMLRLSTTFLPLKDLRLSDHPMEGSTWFMSSLSDSSDAAGEPAYMRFPSAASGGRLLCLAAGDPYDGARNTYALAYREALPENSTIRRGLTFISDTYYDYDNICHGLSALLPFARWHAMNGCKAPARWVLFHWGEPRKTMGNWVRIVAEASTGAPVRIEGFEGKDPAAVNCFEEAVVIRRNDGGMAKERKEEVYDMIRCRARAYCNLTRKEEDSTRVIRMTLLFRVGARSFKNETAVAGVFTRECRKVEGCRIRLARPNNLSFCHQVKLMSETDILVSPHGAQLTNMIFMEKNSSVLEFFPKGWLELAGAGQYVYQWLADWSGMRHQGQWRDPAGQSCPFGDDKPRCFTFHKDAQIGHDELFFSQWAAEVLRETKVRKSPPASTTSVDSSCNYCED
ncbi:hypothetical protein AXF42_Ash006624 [Apostasia shenzhenica]|uniref:Glycosyltransferase 61 catalytic domain-containing protein n=1 Tax=Apostasia shenzhenica TaxID=1088818 RepID=A0A2I0AIN0_9ASPA|nr:hypothetical protein AXF42_Ash006624 [Apostasia shenzhenica]